MEQGDSPSHHGEHSTFNGELGGAAAAWASDYEERLR
jgi:hypothetical protein